MERKPSGQLRHVAWICLLACLVITSSCRHRKDATSGETASSVAGVQDAGLANKVVDLINAGRQTEQYLTAKASVKLEAGQKDVSVSGTLRMKRDEVIQLSLAFLGLMEVGRMEITPEYFLLMDRMNHQYVRVTYADVPFFQQAGIDFHTFQSLFWGELFQPANSKTPFRQQIAGDTIRLSSEVHSQATLQFVASVSRALLMQTSLTKADVQSAPLMSWDYDAHKPYGGKKFPTTMKMKLMTGKTQAQVTLNLSNLKNNSDWNTRTEVNTKKYKEVTVESIVERLKNLSL
ncbi:MAG: DUF4292 domain-containing protein [Bacteroidaceae bacterium]